MAFFLAHNAYGLREICIQVQHRVEQALQPVWTKIEFLTTSVQSIVDSYGQQEQRTTTIETGMIVMDVAVRRLQEQLNVLVSEMKHVKAQHRDIVRTLTARIHILEEQVQHETQSQDAEEMCL